MTFADGAKMYDCGHRTVRFYCALGLNPLAGFMN
jgi:hypothetical protein